MYLAGVNKSIFARKTQAESSGYSISGIYSISELKAIITYERSRADRENGIFSIIHLRFNKLFIQSSRRVVKFLVTLKKVIRDIDHLGRWDNETFAVLLPSTDFSGAKKCMEKIKERLFALGYEFDAHTFSYPEHWLSDTGSDKGSKEEPISLCYENVFSQKLPFWKRSIDLVGSLTGIILLTPLFALTALYIKIFSPGHVFFTQKRVGYRGQEFDMYKFRSMYEGNNQAFHGKHACDFIENADIPMIKLDEHDPRIIPGGKLMRKLCIDELPQLLNVLKGDMSLVGPRPCIPYEKDSYLRWHTKRFDVTPGMTGLWQISGKNRLTFKQMVRLDIVYCRNMSFMSDIKILLLTIPVIFKMVLESVYKRFIVQAPVRSTVESESLKANA